MMRISLCAMATIHIFKVPVRAVVRSVPPPVVAGSIIAAPPPRGQDDLFGKFLIPDFMDAVDVIADRLLSGSRIHRK